MKGLLFTAAMVSTLLFSGCGGDPKSARGFSLPEGDADKGKTVFVKLQCNGCHTVGDIEKISIEGGLQKSVQLGGKVTKIKTHGELVTSVINPDHRIAAGYPIATTKQGGKSKMPGLNSQMSVQELIDLIAFMESSYEFDRYSYRQRKDETIKQREN
jgi:hypothetical protein